MLRLPALIAGLLSLPLIGYLALRLGSLLAAWLAMIWAVLHPWYLELATSARGYTFAMCFLALAAVAAVADLQGRWRLALVGRLRARPILGVLVGHHRDPRARPC